VAEVATFAIAVEREVDEAGDRIGCVFSVARTSQVAQRVCTVQ
jgi:hypothetical protein